jgi:uncharacterized protein (TIGR00661 family)
MMPLRFPVTEHPSKKVFVSPLHWGLGHASRCVPIIRHLQKNGFEVLAGANNHQKELLECEIPDLSFYEVPELEVRLGISATGTMGQLLKQALRIPLIIREEQSWIKKFVATHQPDLIISDNRYGFYHPDVRSILITHQLNLQGLPFSFSGRSILYHLFKRFDEIWVPDFENRDISLAGNLSANPYHHLKVKYIGPISRFEQEIHGGKKSHVLFVISGPEPQRSIFEEMARKVASRLDQKSVIVRGTGEKARHVKKDNLEILDLAAGPTLQQLFSDAAIVVCRPGYSTIMDLMAFRVPAIFIPTRGQSEQEYLANYLNRKMGFMSLPGDVKTTDLESIIRQHIQRPIEILREPTTKGFEWLI